MSHFKFFLFVFVALVFSNMLAAKDLPISAEENLKAPADKPVTCGPVTKEVVMCKDCRNQLICKPNKKPRVEKCPQDKSYCNKGKCNSKPGPLCGSIHTKAIFE